MIGYLPADGKELLGSGGDKLLICGLWPKITLNIKSLTLGEKKLLDCPNQVLFLQVERKTRGERSPRCRRVNLEERQEVSVCSLLDQVRFRRCGEATELAEGAGRHPFPALFLDLVVVVVVTSRQ